MKQAAFLPWLALGALAAACGGDDDQRTAAATAGATNNGGGGSNSSGGTNNSAGVNSAAGKNGSAGSDTTGKAGAGGTDANGGKAGAGGTGTNGGRAGAGGTDANGGSGTAGKGGSGTAGSGGGDGKTVTDDFERATLGANWDVVYPTGGDKAQVRILGNSDLGMAAGNMGFFLADWSANTFSADQFCEAVISPEVTTSPEWAHQVYVRRRNSDGARYGFGYDNDPTQAQYQRWYFKYDGVAGPNTRYFGVSAVAANELPKPGDKLRVEIQGYRLRGYWNGKLVSEATDTDGTKIADGRPGLASRIASGNGTLGADTKVWESFSAGSL